jgi:RNA methyltransferase, TrmH family
MSDEVLLEGPRVVRQAVAAGVHLDLLALREGDQLDLTADRTVVLSRGLFRDLSQTQTPQGVLAVGRAALSSPAVALAAARAAGWPLLVLDRVQDPGNVGAIARTAAAAGAPALAVLPGTADPFGAKAIRASAGHVFNLVVAEVGWEDLAGIRCLGASAGGTPLEEADLASAGALVLGSEAHGLSREVETIGLPMAPGVESLNVAAAAAILLYELRRRIAA